MMLLHIFKCCHPLCAGFHGEIGGEPVSCFGRIYRITLGTVCPHFTLLIWQFMCEFSI